MAANTYPDRKGGTMVHFGTVGATVMRIETRGLTTENIPIILTNVSVADSSEKVEITDGSGNAVGLVMFNPKKTLTATGHITGTTVAEAKTNIDMSDTGVGLDTFLPGDNLEFDWTGFTLVDDANRLWVIETISRTYVAGGLATFDITAIEYANTTAMVEATA